MLEYREEHIKSKERKLRDFIPVALTFFMGLVVLSVYQNAMLYAIGVLDSVFNKSFLLYLLHHLGFASVISLFLAIIFNILENKKPGLGLRSVQIVLIFLLLMEAALITYYVQNFEPLGSDFFGLFKNKEIRFSLLQASVVSSITLAVCFICYKYIASFYTVISRMYPLTIVFFSIFLATLYSDKKPVNENKTQYLAQHVTKRLLQSHSYKGITEYPLVRPFQKETGLVGYFKPMDTLPNIKIIIMDGLGNEFVDGRFTDFMPNLQKLKRKSLSWKNFLSNTGESNAALPMIVGSLPFGEAGFTTLPNFTYRNTLYSILREYGYRTSFNHGGNTALFNIDRFLEEEKVDQIFDRNNFGREFGLQEEDAAGITLGYPDGALFSNFHKNAKPGEGPKLDVFLTLSTKAPYHIPNIDTYTQKVANIMGTIGMKASDERFVRRNEELFASFLYADEALAQFMVREQLSPDFTATIYVITGSHQLSELSQDNALSKYRVPLLIFSPLLKCATEIENVASHADIAPSLLALLSEKQNSKVPDQVGFLGGDLLGQSDPKGPREVPLLRSAYKIQDFILDDLFYSDGEIYRLDKDLNLSELEDDNETRVSLLEERFQNFKTVNSYVTENNRIMPKSVSLIEDRKPKFSKEELIWIESVFNGRDFDNAYGHAKQLAFKMDYDRALLLCEYILSQIPRHADTEILMGRVRAWQGDYDRSVQILNNVIRKYPSYGDGYCALMDAYFWSGKNENMYEILRLARKNGIQDKILSEKLERSLALIRKGRELDEKSAIEQETVEIGSRKK